MKVTDTFHVKNHGHIARVEDLPEEPKIYLGDIVRQGDHAWKIIAVEEFHTKCFNPSAPEAWGFALVAEPGSPDVPERGELTHDN